MLKKCSKCGEEKPATTEYFYREKKGLRSRCKSCMHQASMKYQRENSARLNAKIRLRYHDGKKQRAQEYYRNHKEEILSRVKIRYEENRAKIAVYKRENADKLNSRRRVYMAEKRVNDPMFRVVRALRDRVRRVIVRGEKSARSLELIGCSVDVLKSHLEMQFDEYMSWGNYGTYWHVDHIRPCASFNLSNPEEQKQCFHYSNLQPLEAKENIIKGAKWSS